MERQQTHYRTVLETANQGAEDNSLVAPLPAWAIPKTDIVYESIAYDVFNSQLGKYIGSHADMMNYFQFCRIIETLLVKYDAKELRDVIRFRRKKSLSFPAGEITTVEKNHYDKLPSVRTTFLGLYGVDSILPDYFLNDIATNKEGSESLAAFLDIFNHRISELFYAAWKKYRYPFQFAYGGTDDLSISLLHLIGQIAKSSDGVEQKLLHPLLDSKILGLLGVFHQKTHTADGIACIVKYLSPKAEVTVSEFQPQWVWLDEVSRLGEKSCLKLDQGSALLGRRIKDNSHLIHIDITPNSFDTVQELLPHQATYQKLLELLKIYLGHRIDASIYINIKKQWIPQAKLKTQHMLGINTGLGSKMQDKRIKVGNYTYSA